MNKVSPYSGKVTKRAAYAEPLFSFGQMCDAIAMNPIPILTFPLKGKERLRRRQWDIVCPARRRAFDHR